MVIDGGRGCNRNAEDVPGRVGIDPPRHSERVHGGGPQLSDEEGGLRALVDRVERGVPVVVRLDVPVRVLQAEFCNIGVFVNLETEVKD